jgi:hypothetical protein
LQLGATRALIRHQSIQTRALRSAARILARVNANTILDEFGPPCVDLLRRGETRNSDLASELDIPDDIRQFIFDLGSEYPALGVYAARQLATRGREAKPAIPFLIEALEDHRLEWPLDDESLIGFQTVSSAARSALQALRDLDDEGKIDAALSEEGTRRSDKQSD